MERTYNKKEIEGIKAACRKVRGLIYTASYFIDRFDITPDEKDNIRIDFRIKRKEHFNGDEYITYQTGHFFISPKGKLFYYNFLGNKKPVTHFGPIVSRFETTF